MCFAHSFCRFPLAPGVTCARGSSSRIRLRSSITPTSRLIRTRASRNLDAQEPGPGYEGGGSRNAQFPDGHFLGWTPGQSARLLPDEMAWTLDGDTDLIVEAHLMPSGTAESVQLSVGLYFTSTPPTRQPYTLRLSRQNIDIGAGQQVELIDTFVLPVGVDVLSIQPHAHHLATEVSAFATLPDGALEHLILIKDWNFHWQDTYRYAVPPRLPTGTTLTLRYRYDNTLLNRRNPNRPPRRVTFGQTTASEMANLWLQVLPHSSSDRQLLDRAICHQAPARRHRGIRKDGRGHADRWACTRSAGPRIPRGRTQCGRHDSLRAGRTAESNAYQPLRSRYRSDGVAKWEEASQHFAQALADAPDMAEAAFGLVWCTTSWGGSTPRSNPTAAPSHLGCDTGTRTTISAARWLRSGQQTAAITEYRLALEHDPNDAEVHA